MAASVLTLPPAPHGEWGERLGEVEWSIEGVGSSRIIFHIYTYIYMAALILRGDPQDWRSDKDLWM